jgi:hypothetical protein
MAWRVSSTAPARQVPETPHHPGEEGGRRRVRPPPANPDGSRTYATGIYGVSVRQFLSTHAIRRDPNYAISESSIDGIVWESSRTSTIPNIRGVTVPLLILAMTGHYFVAPDESIYECAASSDK